MMTLLGTQINSARLKNDFEELGQIGETSEGGVSRLALSNEDLEARTWFAGRIEDAGLLFRDDEVGNLSGILRCENPNAKTLLMGSHLDTVPNGGKYNGTVGVLAGLECLRTIKELGVSLPFHLEVINFTDDEGCWQSFFGSMGLTGTLDESHINDVRQDNGGFRAALFRAGIYPHRFRLARRDPETIAGYLELHVEQSDRLYRSNTDIGVVTGIVGRTTCNFTFYGEATHAATTRRERRRDALHGAAVFITRMYALVEEFPNGIFNCGNVVVKPGAFNVIPAQASLRVECRHQDETILKTMEQRMVQLAKTCAEEFNLTLETEVVLHRPVARMNEAFIRMIEQLCDTMQYSHQRMVSLAGHDAQILSPFTPTAMIFIPSADGISQTPAEYTEWEYIEKGATLLLNTLLHLAGITP